MPCYHPIDAWPASPDAKDGRVVFAPQHSYAGARALSVGCGKCIGCQLDRAREWATRIMHEVRFAGFGRSHFVTLTLSPKWLRELERIEPERPVDSVWKGDLQRFMKRLRNRAGDGVKYFAGAEYGERYLRPHYHSCMMYLDLPDLVPWRKSASGRLLYRSPLLEEAWPFGHVEVGTLTAESAEYTARYALKKVPAEMRDDRYRRGDPGTGEVWQVVPEFALMSRGIGLAWAIEFARDCEGGFIVTGDRNDQRQVPVPRYYREKLSELARLKLKAKGAAHARAHAADNDWERLLVREECRHLKGERLARALDGAEAEQHDEAMAQFGRSGGERALGLWTEAERDAKAAELLSESRAGRRLFRGSEEA